MKTFVFESLIMKVLEMVVRNFLIKQISVLLNLNYCSVCFDMQQWLKLDFMTVVKKGLPIFFSFHKFWRDLKKYLPICCIFWSSKSASHAVYCLFFIFLENYFHRKNEFYIIENLSFKDSPVFVILTICVWN